MLSRRKKVYIKLNIVSILFAVVSCMSITLAWFAYSGLVDVQTEVGVKAWYIEFEKNSEVVTNDIVISLSDIYPGMETVKEIITIKNLGDAGAKLKYTISQARILDDEADSYKMDNVSSDYIIDALSHKYPFHIDISLSNSYIEEKDGSATFEVAVSWPLDSGDDTKDSLWGSKAYQYEQKQIKMHNENPDYVIKPAIKAVINVLAEQAIDDLKSFDIDYPLGKEILYDVTDDEMCEVESTSCIKTYVIDKDNLVEDDIVHLLPIASVKDGTYSEFLSFNNSWNADVELLKTSYVLNAISTDVNDSYIKIDGISDAVIGNLSYQDRLSERLNYVKNANGYFEYNTDNFPYLASDECVWTNMKFAYKQDSKGKLYIENENTTCKIIPVIKALKSKLKAV